MKAAIPDEVWSHLRAHQQAAIEKMKAYFTAFDPSHAKAGLIDMPTGSGKSGVIATLAQFVDSTGLVVVLTPRVRLRAQLAGDIRKRFFEHAGIPLSLLPRTVSELSDSSVAPPTVTNTVLVMTPQMLTLLKREGGALYANIKTSCALMLFDEGHYEPATEWSEAVRAIPCPRIVLTATPFRSDMKLFDIDPNHWYRYGFNDAVADGSIRKVVFHKRTPKTAPQEFAEDVLAAYGDLCPGEENEPQRPRIIIRCERAEEIRQLAVAFKNNGRSVVAIHDTFTEAPAKNEYKAVPDPETVEATVWIHQFKLLEGIDDHRFQLLAMYGEPVDGVRMLVQQIGRVIRNKTQSIGQEAYVLDHSPGTHHQSLWESFVEYDTEVTKHKQSALDIDGEKFVGIMRDAIPGLLYVDGRFRRPMVLGSLQLNSLRLPLTATIWAAPSPFSPAIIQQRIIAACEDAGVLFHAPAPDPATAAVFHISMSGSRLLEDRFFPEPRLGVSLVHRTGAYLFVYDSSAPFASSAVDAQRIPPARLRKVFVHAPSTRLQRVSITNSNIGADQIRSRGVSAPRVEALAPAYDEHAYLLTTAQGYSIGRRGHTDAPDAPVRRYMGVESGRISDPGRAESWATWTSWTDEIRQLLDKGGTSFKGFSRWALEAARPTDSTPANILLDVASVEGSYRLIDDDGDQTQAEIELSETCADVTGGKFSIDANGKKCEIEVKFDPVRAIYLLSSPDLDRRYYPTDGNGEGVISLWNREQLFRVIPKSPGLIYAARSFWVPRINFGSKYDDSQTGILGALVEIKELGTIKSEKGKKCQKNGAGWEPGSLFNLVATFGSGTGMASEFSDATTLVCDDLNDESADFIMVIASDPGKGRRRKVVFIHAKASDKGAKSGASHLQEVCGQAQKNLREVSVFSENLQSKHKKWKAPWKDGKVKGSVKHRVIKGGTAAYVEDEIRNVVKDPHSDREVWLLLGNLLEKKQLSSDLGATPPKFYGIQAAYLLHSTITSTAAAGARLRVFCS